MLKQIETTLLSFTQVMSVGESLKAIYSKVFLKLVSRHILNIKH